MKKLSDHTESVQNKRVFVRANFDVPMEDGQVQDTTRIEDVVSTVKLLRQHNCQVILAAHYDRPDGAYDATKSLAPVAQVLTELLGESVVFAGYEPEIEQVKLNPEAPITLLDNLRFWSQEETNDDKFAQSLARMADVYVNQAFANCHREHASMVGVPKYLPSYAGVDLAREIEILDKVRTNPDKPLIVVIGGAKLETKVPLVNAFAHVADKILVGGKIALDIRQHNQPVPENVVLAELIENGKDITIESAEQFAQIIKTAKSIMWNGTMGVFEEADYQKGTRIVAEAINTTPAFTLVGGGDTETALTILDMEAGVDFISTGGGAMLTYLSEGKLPALEVLK